MKVGDYDFYKMPQEVIDFKDKVTLLLDYGKYSSQIVTAAPTWTGREGEFCYRVSANSTGGNDFWTYFWINSGWVWMRFAGSGYGGAPLDGTYLMVSTHGDLAYERILTAGEGLATADSGANLNFYMALNLDGTTLSKSATGLKVDTGLRILPYVGAVSNLNLGAKHILTTGSINAASYLGIGTGLTGIVPYASASTAVNIGTHDFRAGTGNFAGDLTATGDFTARTGDFTGPIATDGGTNRWDFGVAVDTMAGAAVVSSAAYVNLIVNGTPFKIAVIN